MKQGSDGIWTKIGSPKLTDTDHKTVAPIIISYVIAKIQCYIWVRTKVFLYTRDTKKIFPTNVSAYVVIYNSLVIAV